MPQATCAALIALMTSPAAQPALWLQLNSVPSEVFAGQPWIRPTAGRALMLDTLALEDLLALAPPEGALAVRDSAAVIALPRPDGALERFTFVESSIMQPALQQRHPEIRTYLGQGLDDPSATVRFGLGPLGFHAMVLRSGEGNVEMPAWYIDPVTRRDVAHYISYWHGTLDGQRNWICETESTAMPGDFDHAVGPRGALEVVRNEFVIAVAATGEYTQWVSEPNPPSVPLALAAIVQTISRINLILERDGPVRLILSDLNDQIIYTDPATDPYSGTLDDLMNQNDTNLDALIGEGGYSLGHLFHQANLGGKASIASVCQDNRGRGVSTRTQPIGDFFDVDMVAHEIGHQLGAQHTFNAIGGQCGPQRNGPTAYEPGEGNTIMSYAGSCGATPPDWPNGAATPMYSFISMLQIAPVVVGAECVNRVPTGNFHPGANPGLQGPFVVPTFTPFHLVAPAAEYSDPGDSVTYSIEQADLGAGGPAIQDTGSHEPLVRVLAPMDTPERWIPNYQNVLDQTTSPTEFLPLYSRDSVFKAVLRDNVAGAGGWGMGDIQVQFVQVPFPGFQILEPVGGSLERHCGGDLIAVLWDVAGTNEPPFVGAETVDILMSTDNGQSFPWALAVDFPNVGAALVPLPIVPTTQARIMVHASGSIFYDVNRFPFEVATGPPTLTAQPVTVSVCPGEPFALSATVGGGSPRHLQWFKNDVPIADATDSTYYVGLANNFDSGDYHLVVSNGCGEAVSETVRVQVGVTFDSLPVSQSPQPCDTVQLNVAARGVGTLSYQWFTTGGALFDDDHLEGANTATLTFNGVRYEDERLYWCAVTDQCQTRTTDNVTLTLPTPTWAHVTSTGPLRRHQQRTDMAYDPLRGVTVLYGGFGVRPDGGLDDLNDTWEWDGVEWTRRSPPNNPGRREQHEMVFDTFRQQVLLFGGWSPAPDLDRRDVWAYDGTDWTLLAPSSVGPPPPYWQQGDAAFDSDRGKMIVIFDDGFHPDPPTNNTWEFDSAAATWQLVFTGVGPGQNYSPIAYDAWRGYAVGQYYWNIGLTSRYAGGAWATVAANTPPRHYPAMAYDTVRHRATIFGSGRDIGQPSEWHSDTYAFDGADWLQVLPEFHQQLPNGPFPPTAMVFDSRRRAMVMIANDYSEQSLTVPVQTWEYRYRDRVVFDRQPVDLEAIIGDDIQFSAVAAGSPDLTYRWRRNDIELSDGPGPGGSVLSGTTTPVLSIFSVIPTNAGDYSLEVANSCGSAVTLSAALVIAGSLPGDLDGDGDVDLIDFATFATCYSGPGVTTPSDQCPPGAFQAADLDGDGDVDLADFATFSTYYTG